MCTTESFSWRQKQHISTTKALLSSPSRTSTTTTTHSKRRRRPWHSRPEYSDEERDFHYDGYRSANSNRWKNKAKMDLLKQRWKKQRRLAKEQDVNGMYHRRPKEIPMKSNSGGNHVPAKNKISHIHNDVRKIKQIKETEKKDTAPATSTQQLPAEEGTEPKTAKITEFKKIEKSEKPVKNDVSNHAITTKECSTPSIPPKKMISRRMDDAPPNLLPTLATPSQSLPSKEPLVPKEGEEPRKKEEEEPRKKEEEEPRKKLRLHIIIPPNLRLLNLKPDDVTQQNDFETSSEEEEEEEEEEDGDDSSSSSSSSDESSSDSDSSSSHHSSRKLDQQLQPMNYNKTLPEKKLQLPAPTLITNKNIMKRQRSIFSDSSSSESDDDSSTSSSSSDSDDNFDDDDDDSEEEEDEYKFPPPKCPSSPHVNPKHSHWVRRSVRQPCRDALSEPKLRSLLHKLKTNHPDTVVLKLKKYIGPDAPCLVMDTVLDALMKNTACQALYIQNFNRGMKHPQLLKLLKILQRPSTTGNKIWCLNIGETYNVQTRTWEKFTRGLKKSLITHMYASEHTISAELKNKMRDVIRKNRVKHDYHINPENLDVIVRCTHCWWNPINANKLLPYIKAAGQEHLLYDHIGQGLPTEEEKELARMAEKLYGSK